MKINLFSEQPEAAFALKMTRVLRAHGVSQPMIAAD
jgi:hypothetical protein